MGGLRQLTLRDGVLSHVPWDALHGTQRMGGGSGSGAFRAACPVVVWWCGHVVVWLLLWLLWSGATNLLSVGHRSAASDDHLETCSMETEQSQQWKDMLFRDAVEYMNQGFQRAAHNGPMCGEPMTGVWPPVPRSVPWGPARRLAAGPSSHLPLIRRPSLLSCGSGYPYCHPREQGTGFTPRRVDLNGC